MDSKDLFNQEKLLFSRNPSLNSPEDTLAFIV